jgi:hypothetical protein
MASYLRATTCSEGITMPVVKVALDTESFNRLTELAKDQRRPIPFQAEVIVLKVLGLWSESHQETADQSRDLCSSGSAA